MADMLRLLAAEVTEASGTVPAENINKMWSTVVTGLVVVFLILILLVIILWALGKIMNIQRKPKKIKAAEAPAPAFVPVPVPMPTDVAAAAAEEEYEEDDSEIIAVIAAAIAAYGEAEGKQYKIASVKRKEKSLRSSWGAAGIAENTKPF